MGFFCSRRPAGATTGSFERRRRDSNPQVLNARRISSAVPYQLGLRLLGSTKRVCAQPGGSGMGLRAAAAALGSLRRSRLAPQPPPARTKFEPHSRRSLAFTEGVGWTCGRLPPLLGRLRRSRLSSRNRLRLEQSSNPIPAVHWRSRREWDSNPRGHWDQRLSRAPLLAAQPSLQVAPPGLEPGLF